MPIYEYQCAQCGHQIEVLQKVSDEPLCRCHACGQDALDKLVSATHFQLKGDGWYKAPPSESSSPAKNSATVSQESAGNDSKTNTAVERSSGGATEKNAGDNAPSVGASDAKKEG